MQTIAPTPRDERRDRVEKMDEYAALGVPYYWLVDPALGSVELFTLTSDARYARALAATGGRLTDVPGCPGLVIDLDELWRELDRLADEEWSNHAARAAELTARGAPLGVLHGLPIAHEDLVDTADIRTTPGSPFYREDVPAQDAVTALPQRSASGRASRAFVGCKRLSGDCRAWNVCSSSPRDTVPPASA